MALTHRFEAGNVLGAYVLQAYVGRGGYGEVWRAARRDARYARPVALKIPQPDGCSPPEVEQMLRDQLLHEIETWIRASGHPNIVPFHEGFEHHGGWVLVSEYVEEGSLHAFLQQQPQRRLQRQEAIRIVAGILTGLEHLHARGVIHRDLKPGNILMQSGTPRITDFGISRFTQTGARTETPLGSFAYMSPEALAGRIDRTVDLWSTAVLLHEALGGRPPFGGESHSALMHAIQTQHPRPLPEDIPSGPRQLLARALDKTLSNRFSTAREFRSALESLSAAESHRTGPASQAPARRVNPIDGAEMVAVPAGRFRMGDRQAGGITRSVNVTTGFYLYRSPVTNAQYRKFVAATGHRPPAYWDDSRFNRDRQPVVGVDFSDAERYCEWAGGALPTEAQWEWAACGASGGSYPWGEDEPDPDRAHFGGSLRTGSPAEVPCRELGASWCGALDLWGNVWEWCRDWHREFPLRENGMNLDDPVELEPTSARCIRGGSWLDGVAALKPALRQHNSPTALSRLLGFRVVIPTAGVDSPHAS